MGRRFAQGTSTQLHATLSGSVGAREAAGQWAGCGQAQAALGLQPAEAVLVGHSGGHTQPTGDRTGPPGCAPRRAGPCSGQGCQEGSWGCENLGPELLALVTHPLGAAPARDGDPPGVRAVPAGQPHVLAAQWHTADAATLAAAQGPAVGPEGLPFLVLAAVHLAAAVIFRPDTHGPRGPRAGVTLADQAVAGVTDVAMVAGLP